MTLKGYTRMATSPTVLIVEDERLLGELFETWLESAYTVRVANDGERALEMLNDEISMALLDRRMPGLSGDAVLEEIRERGYDFPVAMVTAVDPDFDIVEMGFDDYIVKPVSRDSLLDLVESLIALPSYADAVQQYFQLSVKKAALEANKPLIELESSEEYAKLSEKHAQAKARADTSIESISNEISFAQLDERSYFS